MDLQQYLSFHKSNCPIDRKYWADHVYVNFSGNQCSPCQTPLTPLPFVVGISLKVLFWNLIHYLSKMCKVNSSAGDNSDIRIHHNPTLLCFEFNSQLRIEFQIKRQRGQQRRHTEADLPQQQEQCFTKWSQNQHNIIIKQRQRVLNQHGADCA